MDSYSSELIVRFISDLSKGKNSPKYGFKRPRSYTTLHAYINRLPRMIARIEKINKKPVTQMTEDEVANFFKGMQTGVIQRLDCGAYKDIRSYSKIFSSFWRWHMRVMKKEKQIIPDLTEGIFVDDSRKPKWSYFSLEQAKEMAELSADLYYKALILFLFDSGIRPPKELMNVRIKDLTPVPNSPHLFLQIRDETSKTFGRKIKLMICSETVKTYIKLSKKKPEDFLFHKSYQSTMAKIKSVAYDVLGIGEATFNDTNRRRINRGIRLYDFRHNSVCHYLPLYNSEMQMQYRYGWNNAKMIYYYSEFMGMKDTISDSDMVDTQSKNQLQIDLEKEKMRSTLLQEKFDA